MVTRWVSSVAVKRLLVVVSLLVSVGPVGVAARAPSSATSLSGAAPEFRLSDTGVNGSELNIGVAPNGSVFVGGWDSIARSTDDGDSWTKLNPYPAVSLAADRVLIVDKTTGRVIGNDTTLACTNLYYSDDNGATWVHSPVACGGGVTDHQKVAVGARTTLADPSGLLYPNVMYVCANSLSHTTCGASPDGGRSWQPSTPHGIGCAFQGVPVADKQGTLYEPTAQCGLHVRKTGDNGLTWEEHALPFAASSDTPDLAITPDGTVYFFYTSDEWKPQFARSTDGGQTWTGPYDVPVSGLTSAVFPSIVAGDNGRIALSFYATTDDAAGWDLNPGNAPNGVRWHGYVVTVVDASATAPTVQPVRVTPDDDPLQYGGLSKLGQGLHNIADYMDIDVGPDGRVYAVYADGCLPGCTSRTTSTSDRAVVAIQTTGERLTTTPDAGQRTSVDEITAAAGPDSITVTGRATFVDVPTRIGEDEAGDALFSGPTGGALPLGDDLMSASIARPDPFADTLTFTVRVANPPPAVGGLPEVLQYRWNIAIDDNATLTLQAIRTHAQGQSTEPLFRILRGSDVVATVTGTMTNNVVQWQIPMEMINARAGSVIAEGDNVTTQVGIAGPPLSFDTSNTDTMVVDGYTAPGPVVRMGIAQAGTPPNEVRLTATGTVEPDGGFTGKLTSPTSPGDYTVAVRACNGSTSCALATITVRV